MIKRKETTLTNGFLEINHKASTIYAIEIDDANDDDDLEFAPPLNLALIMELTCGRETIVS